MVLVWFGLALPCRVVGHLQICQAVRAVPLAAGVGCVAVRSTGLWQNHGTVYLPMDGVWRVAVQSRSRISCGRVCQLANAVANECGLRFMSVKGPEILDKYIGASEQAVRGHGCVGGRGNGAGDAASCALCGAGAGLVRQGRSSSTLHPVL